MQWLQHPLDDKNPGIDFKSLPKRVDLVCYSPIRRAAETAELLNKKIDVKSMERLELLHEVKFDRDILLPHEYISLAENRKDILERWYDGRNKKETVRNSLEQVKKINRSQ